MTTNVHADRKARSYAKRDAIADAIGEPRGCDFSCRVHVKFDDGTRAILTGTTNGGFRGIEGRFHRIGDPDWFTTSFTRSLGAIVEWFPFFWAENMQRWVTIPGVGEYDGVEDDR